jgi:hypothetical protein
MADFTSVPYKVVTDSFRENWPTDKGLQATVTYRCDWGDRFALMQDLRGGYRAGARTFGQFTIPHQYPPLPYLYCTEITEVKGEGLLKDLPGATTKWAPFKKAVVTARYAPPEYNLTGSDQSQSIDPQNDPPTIFCRMRVKASAAFRTLPKGKLKFKTSGKSVGESVGKPEAQSEISLEFPHVPFNPYVILKPFLGMINSVAMFGHGQGEILFAAIDTDTGTFANGGTADQSCSLAFLGREVSWRKIINDDGEYEDVVFAGSGKAIFQATNLWAMFASSGRVVPIEDDPYAALY